MTGPPRASLTDAVDHIESVHRLQGREFVSHFGATLRVLKMYPLENEQAQRSIDQLGESARKLHQVDSVLEMQVSGEFVFINRTRLRLGLDQSASLGNVLNTFRNGGIGVMTIDEAVSRQEWQELATVLVGVQPRDDDDDYVAELQDQLASRGVEHITLGAPTAVPVDDAEDNLDAEERAKQLAKRTYQRSVAVSKAVVNSARMGKSGAVPKMKRAVQGIVDQVLNNELSLVGLTAIRDYDEYTFTHSVNVCIFAVAIGKRLGLRKRQLYDLGIAALMHDVGKSRVPLEMINKTGALTEEEWRMMQNHPWYGVLTLFGMQRGREIQYRGIITAYEHHMKVDVTGYPRPVRRRSMTLFSKIVAVSDGFDAATTRRSYQDPIQPDDVLREMWHNRRRGFDPVLVKNLVNLVGVYPVGTCVILDTNEIAVVQGRNPDSEHLNRPVVKVVLTAEGDLLQPAPTADLAETTGGGRFKRSILKVTDPSKYGIKPGDVLA